MPYPKTEDEWIECLAIETARMSYPGGMGRGKKPIVKNGTKKALESYFASGDFPLATILSDVNRMAKSCESFDAWHRKQTELLARFLKKKECLAHRDNAPFAIAAKFLNTFMHQLMKYEEFKPLWRHLHLPLDARVFKSLMQMKGEKVENLQQLICHQRAYMLSRDRYEQIQTGLWDLIDELNGRRGMEFKIESRIELNFLWI